MSYKYNEWNSGLLSCCDDMSSCCYGFWCCPCLACTVSGNFGEKPMSPSVRHLQPCGDVIHRYTSVCAPAGLALRVGIRHMYGIKGSLCKDIATSCVCVWCNWCQMHREQKIRKKGDTVVIQQPKPAAS